MPRILTLSGQKGSISVGQNVPFITASHCNRKNAQASDVITNQRSIATTVNLRDGQTLLLGGLTDYKNTSQDSGVPFLSKIPLIGLLFSSRSDSNEESTLYVLVKATIVRAL